MPREEGRGRIGRYDHLLAGARQGEIEAVDDERARNRVPAQPPPRDPFAFMRRKAPQPQRRGELLIERVLELQTTARPGAAIDRIRQPRAEDAIAQYSGQHTGSRRHGSC